MAGADRLFGQVAAVGAHRLGQARVNALTHKVVLGSQKQHRHIEIALSLIHI